MRTILIAALAALTVGVFAADNEPPKLAPVPKPAPPATPSPKTEASPQQKEIEKLNESYIAAFNQGDPKAVAAFYTEDAEQTDGDGDVVAAGRPAIEKRLKSYFDENKGGRLELSVESVRTIAPEVVLEKGGAAVTNADGHTGTADYLAIHVKHGGKWLITHLTESASKTEPSPYAHLQELEWMIGTWKDNTSEAEVHTTCQWAANKTFMTRSFSAKSKDRGDLEGTEVLGWDPIKGHIRAWVFDSEGGFSEATWTRDGERWLIQSVTTLPDGRKASANNTITRLSDDKYTWESTNRVLDGELRPGVEKIEIDRVKAEN